MSGDEIFALIGSIVIAGFLWFAWYRTTFATAGMVGFQPPIMAAIVTPILSLAVLLLVLVTAASADVRDSATYCTFYVALGAAWIGLVNRFDTVNGLNASDDVIERRNPAAALAWCGALLGHMLAFAGSNIGDGPGWWVVLFTAFLANGTVLLTWTAFETMTNAADEITIERSPGAGLRLGGLLTAVGLIAGRAAAGNWISAEETFNDFVHAAWPVVLLVMGAIIAEKMVRSFAPSRGRALFTSGFLPAAIFLCCALIWILHLGHW
jgi:uncharacterized membrane protein YjfL (UPF0719 family)